MIFSLKLQGLFCDKDKSTRQVSLKTIVNTRIQVILEILPDPCGLRGMIGAKICALMAHIRYDLCTKGHSNHPT